MRDIARLVESDRRALRPLAPPWECSQLREDWNSHLAVAAAFAFSRGSLPDWRGVETPFLPDESQSQCAKLRSFSISYSPLARPRARDLPGA